jgi:hypothetical protein
MQQWRARRDSAAHHHYLLRPCCVTSATSATSATNKENEMKIKTPTTPRSEFIPPVSDCDLCLPEHCQLRDGRACLTSDNLPQKTTLKALVFAKYGIDCHETEIRLSRLRTGGWASVGFCHVKCPHCGNRPLPAFRKPYVAEDDKHQKYWAFFCPRCHDFITPADLDSTSLNILKPRRWIKSQPSPIGSPSRKVFEI